MAEPLLQVQGLTCGHGEAVVLTDVSFTLQAGRSLALLGRNGTGKTTLLDTLVGVTSFKPGRFNGRILLSGRDIHTLPAHHRAAAGVGWVPQERNIFKSLTVEENLSAVARPGPWTLARVYALFPRLQERHRNLGNQLSGGEQQMLAFGRALVLNPKLLLLDEPTAGVPAAERQDILDTVAALPTDVAVVLIEHDMDLVFSFARRIAVLVNGAVLSEGPPAQIAADPQVKAVYLGQSLDEKTAEANHHG